MKTSLLVILLLAPLHPVALGCDKPATTCIANPGQPTSAPIAAKSTPPGTTTAPPAAPAPARRTSRSRLPAHLFM